MNKMNDKQILDNILERRYSCRSFLETPVEQKTIKEILRISQTLGGNNMQWIGHQDFVKKFTT